MRKATFGFVSILLLVAVTMAQEKAAPAKSQMKKGEMSNAQYTARALSAAPYSVAKGAGVARMDSDGKMQTLRESKNGFTCMMVMKDSMCGDANSMAFFDAAMKHQDPPDKLGITYMLRGDNGASNTEPMAFTKTADNHWLVTGPHLMLLGPAAAKLVDAQTSADPDPTRPYVMWANTPYAHVMIPVGGGKAAAVAKPAAEKK